MDKRVQFAMLTSEPQFNNYFHQIARESFIAKIDLRIDSLTHEIDPEVKDKVQSLSLFVGWWKKRLEDWDDFAILDYYHLTEEEFSRQCKIGVEVFVDKYIQLKGERNESGLYKF